MSKQFDQKFKENAVKYYIEHKELGIEKCAQRLGVSRSALSKWTKQAAEHDGEVFTRGSGNYQSDEAKENARLKKELRDTQDALEILKRSKKPMHWLCILGN
jgi:transposase